MLDSTALPSPPDVVAASHRIKGRVHRTPVITSSQLDRLCGRTVYLKCENMQRTGSYKARGAANHILSVHEDPAYCLSGVVAASSGNHGQAVAWMARETGIAAIVVVPTTIRPTKRDALETYGVTIVEASPEGEAIYVAAAEIADRHGYRVIPPYDHPLTIAGQGTCIYEAMTEQLGDVDAVLCPVGGGGLAAGTILGLRAVDSPAAIFGVEPVGADDTYRSIRAGSRVRLDRVDTCADALLARTPGALTFEINRVALREVITVTDAEIGAAMRFLWQRTKLVVEPSGAVALAGLFTQTVPGTGPVVVIVSGGNAEFAAAA